MDFGLNEEQRAIVATVRDFVRRKLVPHVTAQPEVVRAAAAGGGVS